MERYNRIRNKFYELEMANDYSYLLDSPLIDIGAAINTVNLDSNYFTRNNAAKQSSQNMSHIGGGTASTSTATALSISADFYNLPFALGKSLRPYLSNNSNTTSRKRGNGFTSPVPGQPGETSDETGSYETSKPLGFHQMAFQQQQQQHQQQLSAKQRGPIGKYEPYIAKYYTSKHILNTSMSTWCENFSLLSNKFCF